MSEDQPPKVITLKRQPYQAPPPPVASEALVVGPSCPQTISTLEALLEEAKEGQIKGLAAITWDVELKMFRSFIMLPSDEEAVMAAPRFLGGLRFLDEYMMNVADCESSISLDPEFPEDFEGGPA